MSFAPNVVPAPLEELREDWFSEAGIVKIGSLVYGCFGFGGMFLT